MEEPVIKRVKELKSGPVRHESLSKDVLETIELVYKMLGPYLGMSLEEFEFGFRREAEPEREVTRWCRIATGWYSYHRQHTDLQRLSSDEEKKLIAALSLISTGVEDHKELGVTTKTAARLRACYDNPK